MKGYLLSAITLAAWCSLPVYAEGPNPIETIQHKWAQCQYESKDNDQQIFCLENLVKRAEKALAANPDSPELKIWLAISQSSLAGADGGLGALSLVKQAKTLLEDVIKTSPQTMKGSAYTSLGSLYYKVPGWPIGFGDDDKARELLKKAIEINPDGIDSNYFYGDFLAEEGDDAEAIAYLNKALKAAPRVGRELADKGRRDDIKKRLKDLGVK